MAFASVFQPPLCRYALSQISLPRKIPQRRRTFRLSFMTAWSLERGSRSLALEPSARSTTRKKDILAPRHTTHRAHLVAPTGHPCTPSSQNVRTTSIRGHMTPSLCLPREKMRMVHPIGFLRVSGSHPFPVTGVPQDDDDPENREREQRIGNSPSLLCATSAERAGGCFCVL